MPKSTVYSRTQGVGCVVARLSWSLGGATPELIRVESIDDRSKIHPAVGRCDCQRIEGHPLMNSVLHQIRNTDDHFIALGAYYLLSLMLTFRLDDPAVSILTAVALFSFLFGAALVVWEFYKQPTDTRTTMLKAMGYAAILSISLASGYLAIIGLDASNAFQSVPYMLLSSVWLGSIVAGIPMALVHTISSVAFLRNGGKGRKEIEEEFLDDDE